MVYLGKVRKKGVDHPRERDASEQGAAGTSSAGCPGSKKGPKCYWGTQIWAARQRGGADWDRLAENVEPQVDG